MDDGIGRARRLCFFAHFHPHGLVADHVLIYLRALAGAGFTIVVLSTATMSEPEQQKLRDACSLLVMRDNVGLDFGGWVDAVRRFFPIEADLLLFANDSVYAPVGDLAGFIDRLTATPADFYGVVESLEVAPHFQSWFLLFRPSAYTAPAFVEVMTRKIMPDMSKAEIIARYEVGLTGTLLSAGLVGHAAYRPKRDGLIAARRPFNAGHLLWRPLIERAGIPFLKIELLRDNPAWVTDLGDWTAVVDALTPALSPAIADDLVRRGGPTGKAARYGWALTLNEPNPACWPELQPFIRRDYRLGPPRLTHHLNSAAYRVYSRLAKLVRRGARRLGYAPPLVNPDPMRSGVAPRAPSPGSASDG